MSAPDFYEDGLGDAWEKQTITTCLECANQLWAARYTIGIYKNIDRRVWRVKKDVRRRIAVELRRRVVHPS